MKSKIIALLLLLIFAFASNSVAQAIPGKQAFLDYWSTFKNAIRENNADFLFANVNIPFDSQGSYFEPEASLEDVKLNYADILPEYRPEMEFVRFDAILIEKEGAYVWLGYSFEEEAFFYCYKKVDPNGYHNTPTLEFKYWFKTFDGKFKFFKTTSGIE